MSRHVSQDLEHLPVFASLPKRARRRLESLMTPVTFAEGQVLCREDQIGREAFVIVTGTAAVSRGDAHIADVGPGDVVGELALLDRTVRSATVTATEPVDAYVMSGREFEAVLHLDGIGDEVRRVAGTRRAAASGAA